MNFAFPPALAIAAAIVPLSFGLFVWKSRWTRRQLSAVIAPRLREQLTRSIDWSKRRVKALLFATSAVLLLIAIARPQWGTQTAEVDRKNIDFFIALDLSRSMLAEDMEATSRLKVAKSSIDKLLDDLGGGDRVGLIGFAGEAFIAAPVTLDHEAVRRNLASLEPRVVARPGSDIAAAIALAQQTFATGDYESKAVVLVTDGEELQGDAVIAAREAAQKGVRIFTVGVGSAAGARIPERLNGGPVRFAKNEFGNEVVSRMNQRVLQQVAASGRGSFEVLGAKGEGLGAIYEKGLQPLGKSTREKPTKDPQEHFQWPLGVAALLFLTELLVNERRKSATLLRT